MEKLMFSFLDTMNPDLFLVKTTFGNIPSYALNEEGSILIRHEKRRQIHSLCDFFSCSYDYARIVYDMWLETKPVYIHILDPKDDTKYTYTTS